MSKEIKLIKDLTKDLLKKLGYPNADISLEEDSEGIINILIDVPAEDSGLLIGFHGETIFALQIVLGHMVAKKLSSWKKILVNIGDYREQRQEVLQNMGINAAKRAKELNQEITLPHLNSSERRIIHLTLSDDKEVQTYSEGEGRQRRIVVKPVQEKAEDKKTG